MERAVLKTPSDELDDAALVVDPSLLPAALVLVVDVEALPFPPFRPDQFSKITQSPRISWMLLFPAESSTPLSLTSHSPIQKSNCRAFGSTEHDARSPGP
jgi:hypothetical protein